MSSPSSVQREWEAGEVGNGREGVQCERQFSGVTGSVANKDSVLAHLDLTLALVRGRFTPRGAVVKRLSESSETGDGALSGAGIGVLRAEVTMESSAMMLSVSGIAIEGG